MTEDDPSRSSETNNIKTLGETVITDNNLCAHVLVISQKAYWNGHSSDQLPR